MSSIVSNVSRGGEVTLVSRIHPNEAVFIFSSGSPGKQNKEKLRFFGSESFSDLINGSLERVTTERSTRHMVEQIIRSMCCFALPKHVVMWFY